MTKKRFLFGALGIVMLGVIALGTMWLSRPQLPVVDLEVTQAYETVQVRITESSGTLQANIEPGVPTPTEEVRSQVTLTATMEAGSTQIQVADIATGTLNPTAACDLAAPGNPIDVTVSDETEFMPGEAFTKIWRLENIGSCTWTRDYTAQFFYGDRLSAPDLVYLGRDVPPNGFVEIAVDMVAPSEAGTYQGNWKLSNADGYLFGIGPKGDAHFWVRIIVLRVATPTMTPTQTATLTATATAVVTLTPTQTPTQPIKSSGELLLDVDQSVNLDDGQINPPSGQDLVYRLESEFHNLIPQQGAVIGVYGIGEPGLAACQAAGMSPAPIALESLTPGTFLCYKTNTVAFGWLRYSNLDSDDDSVALLYRTWVTP